MGRERANGAALRELLGLRPEATESEVRETYRELEAFLVPGNVPRCLKGWAERERSALRELSPASEPTTAGRAKARPRPSDLPDFFEEDLRSESPSLRRARAEARPPRAGTATGRRRVVSSNNWRAAILIVVLGLVLGVVLIGSPLLGGLAPSATGSPSTGQAVDQVGGGDTVPLDQARVAELTKVVQANPGDTAALFELGEMHFQAGKWQESIDWFTKLLAIDPSDTHARTDVGTSSFNLGRYEDAKAAWEEVARRDPKDAQVHYNLGFLYLNGPAPDLEKARAEWQKVVEIAPDSAIANTAKTHLEALR